MIPLQKPKFILTDIEGTTTSISFVSDELFPYFRENISDILNYKEVNSVQNAFQQTIDLALSQDNEKISSDKEIIEKLLSWSIEDRKITPLKTLQGILWKNGYEDGMLKGHVYEDVVDNLIAWREDEIQLGVFSSGSIAAQKLIFGHSVYGNLTPLFSAYFDTNTGGKRDSNTYGIIAEQLEIGRKNILFLSDIKEELEAANEAGLQTIQLVRQGNVASWPNVAKDFNEIKYW